MMISYFFLQSKFRSLCSMLLLTYLLLLVLCAAATVTEKRKLILWAQSAPTPAFVALHTPTIDALPVDGLVIRGVSFTAQTVSLKPLNATAVRAELMLLRRGILSNVTELWALVHAEATGPLADWPSNAVSSNFAVLAGALRDAGWAGILFDVEDYHGDAWNPALACPTACPSPCLPKPPNYTQPGCPLSCLNPCRHDALAAGKAVMGSVLSVWPNASVLATHGPSLSENRTADFLQVTMPGFEHGGNFAKNNPIVGSFDTGLLSGLPLPPAAGPLHVSHLTTSRTAAADAQPAQSPRFHDGAECYMQSTPTDVRRMRTWMKYAMANSSLTPIALQQSYPSRLTFSPGVYDFPKLYHGKGPGTADMWQNDITISMRGMDPNGGITWAYSEGFEWVGLPRTGKLPVPRDWLQATANARAAGQGPGVS